MGCVCFKKDISIDVSGWGYASGRGHNKPHPFYIGTNEGARPKGGGGRGHVAKLHPLHWVAVRGGGATALSPAPFCRRAYWEGRGRGLIAKIRPYWQVGGAEGRGQAVRARALAVLGFLAQERPRVSGINPD